MTLAISLILLLTLHSTVSSNVLRTNLQDGTDELPGEEQDSAVIPQDRSLMAKRSITITTHNDDIPDDEDDEDNEEDEYEHSNGMFSALGPVVTIVKVLARLKHQLLKLAVGFNTMYIQFTQEKFTRLAAAKRVLEFSSKIGSVANAIREIPKKTVVGLPKVVARTIVKSIVVMDFILRGLRKVVDNIRPVFELPIFDDSFIEQISECVIAVRDKAENIVSALNIIALTIYSSVISIIVPIRKAAYSLGIEVTAYFFA